MDTSLLTALPRFSLGVGDRFAQQATAQLEACIQASSAGIEVTPVWNKSNREHLIIGSEPGDSRRAADAAVRELDWRQLYFLDADHVGLKTIDRFLDPCDFFTLDVADAIGSPVEEKQVADFLGRHPELREPLSLPSSPEPLASESSALRRNAEKYLGAVMEAGRIYRHLSEAKASHNFVTEISMDETNAAQTPVELLLILAAIADEQIPIQTIAPKFTGRFNKGVDYEGDLGAFEQEFISDIEVIQCAIDRYGLPKNLKLSVHSGSDKFSLYPIINSVLERTGAGVHLKTAGTSWLEELIGLAEAGGEALMAAKQIYRDAFANRDELCVPYAAVIDIDEQQLPHPSDVYNWSSAKYLSALRHDPASPDYNKSFRQLLHVAFKMAAKMGPRYLQLVKASKAVIGRNVTTNLLRRHILPLFPKTI